MGPPEGRVRTTVLPECGEGRARAPRFAASVQHMRNRAGSATKTGSIAIRATGRASSPAAASSVPTAHAVYIRNLRRRDRSASTLAGIFRRRRCAAVLHLVLVLPFHPFTLFTAGIFAGCALIGASADMAKFV